LTKMAWSTSRPEAARAGTGLRIDAKMMKTENWNQSPPFQRVSFQLFNIFPRPPSTAPSALSASSCKKSDRQSVLQKSAESAEMYSSPRPISAFSFPNFQRFLPCPPSTVIRLSATVSELRNPRAQLYAVKSPDLPSLARRP
jgi:hypothetical protein